jgi:hypothetical protein
MTAPQFVGFSLAKARTVHRDHTERNAEPLALADAAQLFGIGEQDQCKILSTIANRALIVLRSTEATSTSPDFEVALSEIAQAARMIGALDIPEGRRFLVDRAAESVDQGEYRTEGYQLLDPALVKPPVIAYFVNALRDSLDHSNAPLSPEDRTTLEGIQMHLYLYADERPTIESLHEILSR